MRLTIARAMMAAFAAMILLAVAPARAAAPTDEPSASPRIALVIGNGAYTASPLPTAPNDAGLMAQTLAAAGFDVTGVRDLDRAALRQAVADFLEKAALGGPRGIAVVYLAGHALQVEGENYFAPTDAHLERATARPIENFRVAELVRALAATRLGARVVILDGAYADREDGLFSGGLALVDAGQGTLLASNATPGMASKAAQKGYGTYARILAQNMKQGGVPVEEVFGRVRVAVDAETRGSAVPWSSSKLLQSFTFFDRADNAPALAGAQIPFASLRSRPLREFSAEQAYDVALARDALPSYEEYVTVFPDHPLARRIRRLLALRREALFWRNARKIDAPPAFWTYLRNYPNGQHSIEAQRRLARVAAGRLPPADFHPLVFEVPPPTPDEVALFEHRAAWDDPDLPQPPPPPLFLLPPARPDDLRPPPPPEGVGLLPMPLPVAIPFVRSIIAPGVIMPPRSLHAAYRQPRPFMAGAPRGGVVPRADRAQPSDEVGHALPALAVPEVPPASFRPPVPPIVADPAAPRLPAAPAGASKPSLPVQPRQPAAPTAPRAPAPGTPGPDGTSSWLPAQATRPKTDDKTSLQRVPSPSGATPQAPPGSGRAASRGGGKSPKLEPPTGSKATGTPRQSHRPLCGRPGQPSCMR